jgi:hypothetical protein
MEFATLADLLLARASSSSQFIGFLDANGAVANVLSYSRLYKDSLDYAARLSSAGVRRGLVEVVLSACTDHESQMRLFWACCLGMCSSDFVLSFHQR